MANVIEDNDFVSCFSNVWGVLRNPMMHGRGKMGAAPASDAAACVSVPRLSFFFFWDLLRLGSNSGWFPLNRANSAKIGWYRPNWIVLAGGRNKLKLALNHAGTAEISFEWGPNILTQFYFEYLLLLLCFLFGSVFCVSCLLLSLFCEPRTYNVFFKNILIVKIYRKYK